jgi:hypothetical protein
MKIKRSVFVYSMYKKNIIHLWLLAGILTAILVYMLVGSFTYLLNYLFFRSTPDSEQLTAFVSRDILDYDAVMADIEANGGEQALLRQSTSMFYKANVYQEGIRYRFSIEIDRDKLTDTGVYYDDAYRAYTGITDRAQLKELIPKENYATEHLYFYEYDGMEFLLAMDYDLEDELGDSARVTFAPIGVYSLYMVYDLYNAGYSGELCNYLIDVRNTPVDFEDEDFKDLCMFGPFALAALIAAILLTVFPLWHPTYRQLSKYGRTIGKAVEKVDADYEEFGIEAEEKKTIYLNEWLVQKSFFKNGIEKNYKKQKN